MRNLVASTLAVVLLSIAGCGSLVQQKRSEKTYPHVTMKEATLHTINTIRETGLSLKNTSTPADGIVILVAEEPPNMFDPNHKVEFTIMLMEPQPNVIKVEINGTINNAAMEAGRLSGPISKFYQVLDGKLRPAMYQPAR